MAHKLLGVLAGLVLLGLLAAGFGFFLEGMRKAQAPAPAAAPTPSPAAKGPVLITTTVPLAKPAPTPPEPTPRPGTPGPRPTTPTPTIVPTIPTQLPPLAKTSPVITISAPATDFRKEPYGAIVVLSAPWGSGEGQFGKGGSASGPTSLTVDDQGRIYFVDDVNDRVAAFSPSGGYLASYPVPKLVEDIVFDGGFFYLLDSYGTHTVTKHDPNMRMLKQFPIAKEISLVPSAGGLYVRRGHVYVASLGDRFNPGPFFYLIAAADEAVPLSEQAKQRSSGKPAAVGEGYLSAARVDKSTAVVRIHTPAWQIMNEVAIHFETSASVGFGVETLDQDTRGNLYLATSLVLPLEMRAQGAINQDVLRLVVELSPEGRLVRIVSITAGNLTDVQKDTVLGPSGGIYQLKTSKDGVEVVRW